jgi:hypothetical protein
MRPLAWLAGALACGAAAAQAPSPEVQRALLERQHQSEEFSLQLRQSQSGLNARPEDRGKLDASHLQQRQAQQQLHAQQQRQVLEDPDAGRAGAEQRFERERRAQDSVFGAAPQGRSADPEAGASWTPTLEPRPPVSWTPTLEPRRP